MQSLFKKIRSSRTTRIVGCGLALLLAGVSLASYSYKGTKSFGKNADNKSSLVQASQPSQAKINESVGKLPLAFEPNQGQTVPQVKYLARAKGYTALLTENEAVLAIKGTHQGVLRLKMANAQPATRVVASDQQSSRSNYITKGVTNVPNFGTVTYKGVYPGIDVAYRGNQRNLEYDFVVSPGADPNQIRVAYEGTSRFALDAQGNLELETAAGRTLAQKPVVYQTVHGVRQPVQGEYVLMANNQVSFKLGAYDHSQTLIIDPTLAVLAMIGGTGNDEAFAIAANAAGVYLTGRTASLDYLIISAMQPIHSALPPGNFDVFVTKLDATGSTLVYSSYIGAQGDDASEGIAVDAVGNAYIAGYTSYALGAVPTPVVGYNGAYSAFVAKIKPDGTELLAQTYYGYLGTTQAFGLAMDPTSGAIVIGGLTSANGLPPTGQLGTPTGQNKSFSGGTSDGFIAKFDSSLNFISSTYLGGTGYDQVNSVAVDNSGNIYAVGLTSSGNATAGTGYIPFPTTTSATVGIQVAGTVQLNQQTAFVTKYDSALGTRIYSSIFGVGGETANGVAVDAFGNAYVVGATRSIQFDPITNLGLTVNAVNGSLPARTPVFGTPVPAVNNGSGVGINANPSPTQGFLLTLSATPFATPTVGGGQLTSVAFQAASAAQAGNTGCNLTLPRFGGPLGTGVTTPCPARYGSWNAVAVDSDMQAYVAGQQVPVANYIADIARARTGTLAGTPQLATFTGVGPADNQGFGIAVNSFRGAFFDGITTSATLAAITSAFPPAAPVLPGQPGIIGPKTGGGTQIINGSGTTLDPRTTVATNGGEDVLFGAIQYNDIFASPPTVTFNTVGVGTGTGNNGQTLIVRLFNQLNLQQTCAGGTVAGPFPATAPFTIAQIADTNTWQIQLAVGATNSPGVLGPATFTFTCPGAENVSTVTVTGLVTGPINVTPSNTMTPTSIVGKPAVTQYINPYNQVNLSFTTAIGTLPFAVDIVNKSPNFPPTNCRGYGDLLSLSSNFGTAQPPPNAQQITLYVNGNCLQQLPVDTYSAVIRVRPGNCAVPLTSAPATCALLGPVVDIPWSIQVLSGQVVNQYPLYLVFGNSTSTQQSSFTVQAPATSPSTTYNVNYVPTAGVAGLPQANVSVINPTGSNLANQSTTVTFTVSPVGLGPGVYTGNFQVTSPTAPTTNVFIRAFVGTGLATSSPAGPRPQTVTISVPAGLTATNLTQPNSLVVQGLDNTYFTPYNLAAPKLGTFTPALPASTSTYTALAVSGGACTTYAEWAITNPASSYSACSYGLTVDSTNLAAGQYLGSVNFTSQTGGPTLNVPVTLNVTATPQLGVNVNGAPITSAGVTITGVAGSNITTCSDTVGQQLSMVATGGSIPIIMINAIDQRTNLAPTYMGLNGNAAPGGYLGQTPITNIWWLSQLQVVAGNSGGTYSPSYFNVCVNPLSLPNRAGSYTTLMTVSGGGVGPVTFPITYIVSGTAASQANYQQIGLLRSNPVGFPGTGLFILDSNGNNMWDPTDKARFFGLPGDIPVAGDWQGTGTITIGVFRCSTTACQWFIDFNNNGTWDGVLGGGAVAGGDTIFNFGLPGDKPVVGDWTGDGKSKIGVMRCSTTPCTWILNLDTSSSTRPYNPAAVRIATFGLPGDQPVASNWTGGVVDMIGVFRGNGQWIVNSSNSGLPNDYTQFTYGQTGDIAIVGNWNGTATDGTAPKRVGVFRPGSSVSQFVLNVSGTNTWASTDPMTFFGFTGDLPVVGLWTLP